ncbi:SGNH/GDSL hydrolase family protein [Longispora albida]|uniref:SGNH/GDSL hydrolase family protein n=1 Tax=Longispora albida TaxID=203523 RepID=UPI000364C70F|nr:GDSL-type esterase/lipase family protein [Longispora albida]
MKIVCTGDSLTRAQVSADYVQMLRERPAGVGGWDVTSAGVNYELSSGLRARIGEVIDSDPDIVTVLIGTNDLRSALSAKDAASLRKRWKLTSAPTAATYRENLSAIVSRLHASTHARVALLSPPVIGEDPGSTPNQLAATYAAIVREVATEHGATYLPLFEQMLDYLRTHHQQPRTAFRPGVLLAATAATQHFVLRRSFDSISRSRGLRLTTDTIHLNNRGATMIADLISTFATQNRQY